MKQLAGGTAARGKVHDAAWCWAAIRPTRCPADLDFANAIKKVRLDRRSHARTRTKPGAAAEWQLPEAHPRDVGRRAGARTARSTIQQPLIEPLYEGKIARWKCWRLLARSATTRRGYDLVRNLLAGAVARRDAEKTWRRRSARRRGPRHGEPGGKGDGGCEEGHCRGNRSRCSRGAGHRGGLLPELLASTTAASPTTRGCRKRPIRMTKLVWDNAALISPKTAKELGVANGDMLSIVAEWRVGIEVPAMIMPGQADDSISVDARLRPRALRPRRHGRGPQRRRAAHHGRVSTSPAARRRQEDRRARISLATTQEHTLDGRPPASCCEATLEEFKKQPEVTSSCGRTCPR